MFSVFCSMGCGALSLCIQISLPILTTDQLQEECVSPKIRSLTVEINNKFYVQKPIPLNKLSRKHCERWGNKNLKRQTMGRVEECTQSHLFGSKCCVLTKEECKQSHLFGSK